MQAREDGIYVPPPVFAFRVEIDGAAGDTGFQEASGLQVEFETEDVAEGGQNRFVHKLPKRTKYSNLVLKRGAVTKDSAFAIWVSRALSGGLVQQAGPKTVLVKLLNDRRQPLIVWTVFGAYPLRWEHAGLNAMTNEVLTETVELSYQFFQRKTVAQAA
ncbi:phage tail protein [Sphingomonas xinjiangensis]|uniref:Phage tail-like protein n=1 Tax=Sphingomonas xinjiangensis TaxID=643568 RepID=A0A840YBT4_9SPHN|nr:phage tail protein [Sphingomonas xinjiangensis]MBB5710807.1 phage tail-like protein [Sphingomonas xinjiangensis]